MNRNFTKQFVAMSRAAFVSILVNMCLASTLIASNSNGQTKSMDEIFISIHAEDQSLGKVLQNIGSITKFHFSYYEDDISGKNVTLRADNKSLAEILKNISRQNILRSLSPSFLMASVGFVSVLSSCSLFF